MLLLNPNQDYLIGTIILIILVGFLLVIILIWMRQIVSSVFDGFEIGYVFLTRRPLYVYFHPFLNKLKPNQENILKEQFTFYNRLSKRHKAYFRHRVAIFIENKQFIGKEDFIITEEVKILISATATMLTFGFRDFTIKSIKNIIVYPSQYYSTINDNYHKGEFNVNLKTLVLSWDNFKEGFRIEDDKLNLAIHEFAHAIHFNSIYQNDINSVIFIDTFNELRELLTINDNLKSKLVNSESLRNYAFTNDFELLAVILETFIESPKEFKNEFPEIYSLVKQMLNFNFSGY
ncbi:zinc-dependent peptidase [Formosa maritima]|uniref:Zinc-dependent peptidase n=1 Tax=Formosa maritima TaxID=2592046 RepID=A0A5D0G3A3_9FLAO|nr:zinc-dependent peptidase [Formosa maritima]TYA53161.1 zinc-dependent peptidase [Formosa maritima]